MTLGGFLPGDRVRITHGLLEGHRGRVADYFGDLLSIRVPAERYPGRTFLVTALPSDCTLLDDDPGDPEPCECGGGR